MAALYIWQAMGPHHCALLGDLSSGRALEVSLQAGVPPILVIGSRVSVRGTKLNGVGAYRATDAEQSPLKCIFRLRVHTNQPTPRGFSVPRTQAHDPRCLIAIARAPSTYRPSSAPRLNHAWRRPPPSSIRSRQAVCHVVRLHSARAMSPRSPVNRVRRECQSGHPQWPSASGCRAPITPPALAAALRTANGANANLHRGLFYPIRQRAVDPSPTSTTPKIAKNQPAVANNYLIQIVSSLRLRRWCHRPSAAGHSIHLAAAAPSSRGQSPSGCPCHATPHSPGRNQGISHTPPPRHRNRLFVYARDLWSFTTAATVI